MKEQYSNVDKKNREKHYFGTLYEKIYETYLRKFLDYILSFPETVSREFTNSLAENEEEFQRMQWEEYPDSYPSLFLLKDDSRYRTCMENFQKPFEEIKDCEKTAFHSGFRLVELRNMKLPGEHPLAREGFAWASPPEEKEQLLNLVGGFRDKILLEVRPHYSDEIYVAELGYAEAYRNICFETTDCLSDVQYNIYIGLRGLHLVTFKEYMERDPNLPAFKKPQILIRKPIGYDEIVTMWKKNYATGEIEVVQK